MTLVDAFVYKQVGNVLSADQQLQVIHANEMLLGVCSNLPQNEERRFRDVRPGLDVTSKFLLILQDLSCELLRSLMRTAVFGGFSSGLWLRSCLY